MRKLILSILTCFAIGAITNAQNIIYVNANNSGGDGSGDSWTNAMTSLKTALNNATSSTDEIWVARGTYKPDASDRYDSYYVSTDSLTIIGGFVGNETSVAERDMSLIHTTNATILSGDLDDNDDPNIITIQSNSRMDNSFQVVYVAGDNVTLDGLTIADGHAVGFLADDPNAGAGVFIYRGVVDFTMKNCKLKRNVARTGAGLTYAPNVNSVLTIDACIFEENNAVGATSFYTYASGTNTHTVQVTNSLFENNRTHNSGTRLGYGATAGWIRAFQTGSTVNAILVNNTYVNNIGYGSTGVSDFPTVGLSQNNGTFDNLTIANNIFWGNRRQNGSTITTAFGRANGSTFATVSVSNSIDEDGFSNIPSTNLTSTSNTNPNLTTNFELSSNSAAKNAGDNSKIPNGITTDLAGNSRIFDVTVDMGCYEYINTSGIEENTISMTVYPNPTSGLVRIDTDAAINSVEIFSTNGQKVGKYDSKEFDISNLQTGVYFLKIQLENRIVTDKIIRK